MLDEFEKKDRMENINSLRESIESLKEAHSDLHVASQAFKDSIAKQKELFNQILTMPESSPPVAASSPDSGTVTEQEPKIAQAKESLALVEPGSPNKETEVSINIEGIVSTEKEKPVISK